jgi:poly(3-hydroxybutyrate) depolymerase
MAQFRFRSAGALIVSGFLLTACGGGSPTSAPTQDGTPGPIDTPAPTPSPDSPPPDSSGGTGSTPPTQQPATQANAPVAHAGWDRAVLPGELVVLDGSASRDPNGLALDYSWTQVSGPSVFFAKASTPTISFLAPPQTIPTQLVFQLRVSNPLGGASIAEVVITISPPADDDFFVRLCISVLSIHDLCAGALRDWVGQFNGAPVLALQVPRGQIIKKREAARTPSAKIVDGDPSDWIGAPTMLGGNMRLDAGELVYTDYVFDAYGADDGVDAQRLEVLDPLAEWEERTYRMDQLFQAAGDQFGAPAPIGALDRYGDTTSLGDQADLQELRLAADAGNVYLLARFTTLTDPARPALLILLDDDATAHDAFDVGFGSNLRSTRFERALLLTRDGAQLRNLATGAVTATAASIAVNAAGWSNSFEVALPASLLGSATALAVVAGPRVGDGLKPANVAYRFGEPVAGIYNDKQQALALYYENVDAFALPINLADLRGGATESFRPGPGYFERQFVSGDNISSEQGEDGHLQPYGLYVPTGYIAATPSRLTFWLHYRGGKAHSGAAWTPRLMAQHGEQRNNLVATPRARGTSTWYTTRAHQDFFEVFNDLAGTGIVGANRYENQPSVAGFLNVDPSRVYLTGYSMGGYGTYLFGLLYPDLFAAGFSVSGAVTQGLWTGYGPDDPRCEDAPRDIPEVGEANFCFGEANDSDANAQLNYRLLENARHFPIIINHGTDDELVPITGVQRMGARLLELGYRYDLEMYLGYEHYTQAIIDQWDDGAEYLNKFARPANPRHVTYKVSPALVRAVNTIQSRGMSFSFNPDSAWWVSDVAARNPDANDPTRTGMIDVESLRLPANKILAVPRVVDHTGSTTSTPVASPRGQSTPYIRHGQDWIDRAPERISNAFNARLTGVGTATLDATRMALNLSQRVDGAVISDGDSTLVLDRLTQPVQVFVNGFSYTGNVQSGRVALPIPAGINHVVVVPPGAAGPSEVPGGTVDLIAVCNALGDTAEPVCQRLQQAQTLLFNSCDVLSGAPLCALAEGNLHSLIDQCRKPANHFERVCKSAEQVLYGLASSCRQVEGVPAEFCALFSGDLIAPGEVLNFGKSWAARAQALQRALGEGVPFHDAEFPATHNSFNWTTANDPPTISGSDPNQKYSIPDQLRMGIRALEVDVHWMPSSAGTLATQFRAPIICHGNANHAGCTYERPLAEGLNELRNEWLESHPDQVVILYLEAHLDEQIDQIPPAGTVPFDVTADIVESVLGSSSAKDLIFRPAEHASSCGDDSLPLSATTSWVALTRQQILDAGKQVLIITGTCGNGAKWPALAHNKDARGGIHYTETSENTYAGFAYPQCQASDGAFSASEYANKWTRFFEDSTWLSAIVNGPSQPITAPQLREMMRCGVNMPSLDQITPSDPRLAAFVWSWRVGEPDANPDRHCARQGSDGRFAAEDCTRPLRFACVSSADPRDWQIAAPAGAWNAASCPAGYAFGVPRTGNFNEFLKQAKAAAGVADVWLNYTNSGGDWTAP